MRKFCTYERDYNNLEISNNLINSYMKQRKARNINNRNLKIKRQVEIDTYDKNKKRFN